MSGPVHPLVQLLVHVLVPATIDDPARPSGGNIYDRRVCAELVGQGWAVLETHVDGDRLTLTLAAVPDGAPVLLDGLLASAAPDVVLAEADRLRLVVLVHMPWGRVRPEVRAGEQRMLAAVAGVIATSAWTRDWLLTEYALEPGRVRVALPGVDLPGVDLPGAHVRAESTGARLLSVGALIGGKGHDVLVDALARIRERTWHCVLVGSPEIDPDFSARLEARIHDAGLTDRIDLVGALSPTDLAGRYDAADLLVVPSRIETYGMVVTEALARGLPVLASDVGGLPEALGRTPDGDLPGALVPPADPDALATALAGWLDEPRRRARWRRRALDRRTTLAGWPVTAQTVAEALRAAAAEPGPEPSGAGSRTPGQEQPPPPRGAP